MRIRYDVGGVGRPAIVFVHGWCCDRTTWQPQAQHFSLSHLVVTLDLAGHGDSDAGREAWSMEAFSRDVTAVIEKLGLTEAVLVGHAMGGAVILEVARRSPERVLALVAVETFFDVEHRLTDEQAEQFLTPFRSDFRGAASSFLRQNLFDEATDDDLREAIVADVSGCPSGVGLGSMKELLTYDTVGALREVSRPLACINSDKYVTKADIARRYRPELRISILQGAGHFLMMERPDDFNHLLQEMMDVLDDRQTT